MSWNSWKNSPIDGANRRVSGEFLWSISHLHAYEKIFVPSTQAEKDQPDYSFCWRVNQREATDSYTISIWETKKSASSQTSSRSSTWTSCQVSRARATCLKRLRKPCGQSCIFTPLLRDTMLIGMGHLLGHFVVLRMLASGRHLPCCRCLYDPCHTTRTPNPTKPFSSTPPLEEWVRLRAPHR